MIDDKILDEVLPLPTKEELKNKIISDLERDGFKITNFSSGGIFYTIIMIFIQIRIELVKLLRKVLTNMFVSSAKGIWLDLKGADYSKRKKEATKTQGHVTIKRKTAGTALKIPKGYVFKTEQDINDEEFNFIVLKDVVMKKDDLNVLVLVEAEKEGIKYNLPPSQIKKSLIHIEGIDEIVNESDWITKEGSDLEDEESFRRRVLSSWAELSTLPIKDKYKNVCEAVTGVLFATVIDTQPRGQGTIDIIITSTAGAASQNLLNQVSQACEKIKAPYDNLLVKSATVVPQNLDVELYIPTLSKEIGLVDQAKGIIIEAFKMTKKRNLNELYKSDLIYALKKDMDILNVKITNPADDVVLSNDKVIVLGQVNVTIQKV